MRIVFYSSQPYDEAFFTRENAAFGFELEFAEVQLRSHTVSLAAGAECVCIFVNDRCHAGILEKLPAQGVRMVALRCAGFNNVDLEAARQLGITVVRVPAYSPQAVAEHAVAILLTLNRKTHKAYNRVREQNFALQGLLGFDLHGKTIGVIGTGNIGQAFCNIMLGFGCTVMAYDIAENEALKQAGVVYAPLNQVLQQAHGISLHCPLNAHTRHLINAQSLASMRKGVMLINTSRGALVDTKAAIDALKTGQLGSLGIDVYEQEDKLFFRDLSEQIIEDDTIMRLMSFPNVLVTAHQAFFTEEALTQIAQTTLGNVLAWQQGNPVNVVAV
ncbi:MAG TPA: 2-hydroxyacid dehydrogenase [Phnomibacter sp.]|nr:2-hydroxyacid dehydrogenase [Phnomibacter sp.]